MTATEGKTYQFEDYRGWRICACCEGPKRWFGFAKPPGDPYGPFTLKTGALLSSETAFEAIKQAVDLAGQDEGNRP